jgi:hypothetical protein
MVFGSLAVLVPFPIDILARLLATDPTMQRLTGIGEFEPLSAIAGNDRLGSTQPSGDEPRVG